MQKFREWCAKRLAALRAERTRGYEVGESFEPLVTLEGKVAAFEEMEARLREEQERAERMHVLCADLDARRERTEAAIVEDEGRKVFLAMQGADPHWMEGPDRGLGPPTGKLCSVCREPQYKSYGGDTCKNGHGGADPLDE